jgi:cytochrome d ubiquinol oxidase subunit II
MSVLAMLAGIAFVAWTAVVAHNRNSRGILPTALVAAVTTAALLGAVAFTYARRSGWAFAATALSAVGFVATIFAGLYPRVLVSHPSFANSLTVSNAASAHYALKIITIVAAIFVPLLLVYQSWTYYVFRRRLGGEPVTTPAAAVRGASARRTA